MWCCNNLNTAGERIKIYFRFGIVIVIFVFGVNLFAHAYETETIPTDSYQLMEFKLNSNPINSINDITLPINDVINEAVKGLRFNQDINMGTWIPVSPIKSPSQNVDFSRFFSSSKVSPDDVMSFLREAAVTGINLSILIVSVTAQVLKGLLSVIK